MSGRIQPQQTEVNAPKSITIQNSNDQGVEAEYDKWSQQVWKFYYYYNIYYILYIIIIY